MVTAASERRSQRIGLPRMLQFALSAFASSGLVFALSIHIPRYFATHIGVSLGAVGLAFTVVRLIDIGVDPVLGVLMDRTRTVIGRYRLWLLMGTPFLMLASYMLFMAQPGVGLGYLILWVLVLYFGISMTGLAQAAWAGTLSSNYGDRARIFGVIGGVGGLGSAFVMLVPSIVAHWHPNDDLFALRAMGWTMIVLLPVCVGVTALTREELRPTVTRAHASIRQYLRVLWRPTIRRLVAAGLAGALGPGMLTPIFVFYWRDARLVSLANTNIMLVMFMVGSLTGAPIWGMIAGRFGKHRTIIASAISFAIAQVGVVSLPKGSPFVFEGMFAVGFLIAAIGLLTNAIMSDVADEIRLDLGRESSGLLFAFMSTVQKIGGAVSISLSFWILALLGYDPKAGIHNTAAHLSGLELEYALAPITFVLLSAALFIRFPLDAKRHAEIAAKLAQIESEEQGPEAQPDVALHGEATAKA